MWQQGVSCSRDISRNVFSKWSFWEGRDQEGRDQSLPLRRNCRPGGFSLENCRPGGFSLKKRGIGVVFKAGMDWHVEVKVNLPFTAGESRSRVAWQTL